jgi:LysR family transcriptional regulator of gallate degradation
VQGLLAVGTLPYSTGPVVAAAIQDVTARWPGVQVTVVDGAYESLMAQLRRGEIDIVVGALRAEVESDLQQHRLFDDPLSILVRAHHPLLRKRRLDLAGVASADWVLPMPGSPAFSVLMRLFGEQQLPVPKGVSINSPTLLSAIVQRSDRLALMPVRQWQSELDAGLLCQLPLRLWNVHRTIGYTVRKAFSPTPVLSAFQAALSQGAQAG